MIHCDNCKVNQERVKLDALSENSLSDQERENARRELAAIDSQAARIEEMRRISAPGGRYSLTTSQSCSP